MSRTILISLAMVLVVCGSGLAQSYQVSWYSISSGGGETSGGNYRIRCTVGQPAAGYVASTSLLHWVGFWSGDVPTPTVVAGIGDAKLLDDGAYVSVSGKIATSAGGDFAGFFYIEEEGRIGGIRIAAPPSSVAGLARGSVVNVIGTMGATASGERQIQGPIVIVTSTTTPLTPLGMPTKSLGGGDFGAPPLGQYGITGASGINNVGMLIKTWGLVTEAGSDYVVIDDGSGGVRVDTSALATQPALNSWVGVIGISSIYMPATDRLRLVLPRGSDSVTAY